MPSRTATPKKLTKKERKLQSREINRTVSKKEIVQIVPSWILPAILLLTFLAYTPVLSAGFVNWDDPDYINKNPFLKNLFDIHGLLQPVQGNYHPITMFTLALNYAISGMDAWSYHLFNIILHLANAYLLFQFVLALSRRNVTIAFVTTALFAIHPMHVESVAWVSERKDLVYSFFFLLGLRSYLQYIDQHSKKGYYLTLLYLVLALLSKPAAVIFPIALFSIDFLRGRKFGTRLITEKLLFLLPAFLLGWLTYTAQNANHAVDDQFFGVTTRIFFGFYGIMLYFIKLFLPFNLASFYPYPALNEPLPASYYLSPLFFAGLAILCLLTWRKNRVYTFGISFYIINLLLVLQFLPVGSAIVAERYTYIPYIGLFYILGWLLDHYAAHANLSSASRILVPVCLILAFLTFRQSATWHDGASLWDQAIKAQPSANAYGLRASLLRSEKKYDQALALFNEGIHMNAIFYEGYTNRGNIYFDLQKWDSAYADYRKALSIKPDYYPALDNMGAWYGVHGQFDSALYYLNRALTVKPDYSPSYSNRGLVNMNLKRYNDAISDFKKLLQYEPEAADIYNSIGSCYQLLGNYAESLSWINRAIDKSTAQQKDASAFYLNRSYTHYYLKNIDGARKDALTARQYGSQLDKSYAASLGIN
jgi:tetratricopeptide (TPR) repeat protein